MFPGLWLSMSPTFFIVDHVLAFIAILLTHSLQSIIPRMFVLFRVNLDM